MTSKSYLPTDYTNGTPINGTTLTGQEHKIDAAFQSVEGPSFLTGMSISANKAAIDLTKGSPWDSSENLHAHETRLDQLDTDTSALNGQILNKKIYVADIIDNSILARESNLQSLAGEAEPFSESVKGNATDIATNASDIVAVKGSPWDSTKTLAEIFSEFTGHGHQISDITGLLGTFATDAELDAVKGTPWTTAKTVSDNYALITTGESPGHTHKLADITGIGGVATQAQLLALEGVGYDSSMTVAGNANDITAVKGVGWDASQTLSAHNDSIVALQSDSTAHSGLITGLQAELDAAEGTGYTNTIVQPTNVTGVDLVYPSSNGTPASNYDSSFREELGDVGYPTMGQWDGCGHRQRVRDLYPLRFLSCHLHPGSSDHR